LKKYKSPGSDQILAELVQAGGKILLSAIHKLINSVWNKEELPGRQHRYYKEKHRDFN
jgi:citrate synthase